MYGYAKKALHQNDHVASERFGDLANNADYVPVGQSLWYQVFNPTGKGVGLFAQTQLELWKGGKPCGEFTANKTGAPHNSQQSLFSVLIVDAGDKSFFQDNQQVIGKIQREQSSMENISGVTNVEMAEQPLPMALMLVQKNQRKLLLVSIPLLVLPVRITAVFSGTTNL